MPTINANRLSRVEYSTDSYGYIRSLACLTGFCYGDAFQNGNIEVQLDNVTKDCVEKYLETFDKGFTLFVCVNEEITLAANVTYTLKFKYVDDANYYTVGTISIPIAVFAYSELFEMHPGHVMVLHQTSDGVFTLCNYHQERAILSPTKHQANVGYVVAGIGNSTNSSKYLRSDGTWQTPSNTTYATLATNAHASGTNYVVNGPGNSTNTFLRGDGTWKTAVTIALNMNNHATNTVYGVFGSGYSSNPSKFLREDGTWQTVSSGTTYGTLSASSHASGTSYLVNGIGSTTNAKEFLRNDGTWQTPTDTTYASLTSTDHARVTPYVVHGMGTVSSGYDIEKYYLTGSGNWKYMLDTLPPLNSTNHSSSIQYSIYGIGSTTNTTSFLRNDGTWQTPANTTYAALATNAHATNTSYVVKGSGYSGTGAGTKFLREDGTWQPVSGTDEQVKQEYTSLSKYFPILLSDNQLAEPDDTPTTTASKSYMTKCVAVNASECKIYALGFATVSGGSSTNFWTTDGGATGIPTLSTATHSTSVSYLVKGSGYSSNPSKFLREDGSWQTVSSGSTYGTLSASSHASGTSYVVNGPGTSTNKFLRGDGSWSTPTNTTYGTFTTAANGLVPKPTSATATTNYVLAGNGTWVTMSGGGSAQQAWGMYGFPGTPVQGISMPTSQNRSNFPIVSTTYDGTAAVTSVLFPTKNEELVALPIEISMDGVIYVPVSSQFSRALEEWGYERLYQK